MQIYEPSELERGHLTDKDKMVAMTDLPERFQVKCCSLGDGWRRRLEEGLSSAIICTAEETSIMLSVACSVICVNILLFSPAQLTAVLCHHLAASRCLQQGVDKGDVLARKSLSKMINVQLAACTEVQRSVTLLYDVHMYVS